MNNIDFGITVTVVGMGGTILVLWIISVIVILLKKAFPYDQSIDSSKKQRETQHD
jgi:Na+-transporting methylmalonyl-CoA/oxaloacetate decarboxylase gamma subunit